MPQISDCFVRLKDGEWFCRAPCTIDGPTGRVNLTPGVLYRRGRLFMGLDIAALLEEWLATGRLPPNFVWADPAAG
jgi:hypothetical protein